MLLHLYQRCPTCSLQHELSSCCLEEVFAGPMALPSFCCWLLVLGPRAVPVQEAGEEDAGPSQLAQQAAPAEVLTGIAERSVSLNLQVQGQESDLRCGAP